MYNFIERNTTYIFLCVVVLFSRIPFFSLKYLWPEMFKDSNGSLIFSLLFGGCYILPLIWSNFIRSYKTQTIAVISGLIFILISQVVFFYLDSQMSWIKILAIIFFGLGFSLSNPNLKSLFGFKLAKNGDKIPYFLFMLLINISAIIASLNFNYDEIIFLIGTITVTISILICFKLFFSEENIQFPRQEKTKIHISLIKKFSISYIILLSILFWGLFELKSNYFHSIAFNNEKINKVSTLLQGLNPFFYIILFPISILIANHFKNKSITNGIRFITPIHLMGFSVLLISLSTLIFSYTNEDISTVSVFSFVSLYFFFTVAEIIFEPLGLDLVSNVSNERNSSFLFTLWDLNSGIAYLGGFLFKRIDEVSSFSLIVVVLSLIFLIFSRKINNILNG